MSVNLSALDPFQWGLNKVSSAIASVTISPYKDLLVYAFPPLKAVLSKQNEIKEGSNSLGRMVEPLVIRSLYKETKRMMACGGVEGDVKLYTALNAPYEGNGSRLGSVMVFPLEDIFDRKFESAMEEEELLDKDELNTKKRTYSDNEVRFQMARAVVHMAYYSVIKIAARVAIAVFAIALYFTPIDWMSGLLIFLGAAFLYHCINRVVEGRADKSALQILSKRFEMNGFNKHASDIQATYAGINCLKKIQLQNLEQRNESKLCKLAVNEKGDLRFDYESPSLTSRIGYLEKHLAKLLRNGPADS